MKLHNCKYVVATGTTGRYAGCDLLAHPEVNELYCLWNCGFYSCETQVFNSLLILLRHGLAPDRIDYSLGYRHFKKDPEKDIYPDFHQIDSNQSLDFYTELELPDSNKCQFGLYNFNVYNQIISRFFGPSNIVKERKDVLIEKYNIDFSKTISVLYRGTDKGTELTLASPQDYMTVVKNILKEHPDFRVLIQTDQTQVIQYFHNELGDKVFWFNETPSTSTSRVIWSLMEDSGRDAIDWSQWFDAALRCTSDCEYAINHTGNVGFWLNLYRGNTDNVYQFDENGQLT